MDTAVAFTIIGCVLGFVGIMFNVFPKQINQKLMGDLSEEASQVSAGFRIILGGVGITLAIVALSSRNFSPAEAKSLLYALGTGFVVIVTIFATVKLRGFGIFPLPPAIMFLVLAAIAFYTGSGLTVE
tara:strand:+ start:614 stop:997 length:384 start_codon:yes stop_codon:yes gene_type:complete